MSVRQNEAMDMYGFGSGHEGRAQPCPQALAGRLTEGRTGCTKVPKEWRNDTQGDTRGQIVAHLGAVVHWR